MNHNKKLQAFTLNELLVVLLIIGVLVAIALPSLMPLITKARSTEAKLQLKHIHTLEESFYLENLKYSSSIDELGFEQGFLTPEGGNANYLITIETANATTFVARAKAVVDFDKDGIMNVWEIDQDNNLREIVKD